MTTLHAIEVRTGHRQPPNPMRTIGTILLALVFLAFLLAFTGCSTTTVRTITTDKGGRVTDVTTTTKATDPAALALAGVAITAYAPPRARYIREEKAATPADLRRILHGRPITKQEIANRWKP